MFPGEWTRLKTASLAELVSPLATFALDFRVDGASVPASIPEVFSSPAGGRVFIWSFPQVHAELLIRRVLPDLPDGMVVDGCTAAVWRVLANEDLADCSFYCTLIDSDGLGHGGPCSGQGLEAQEWGDGKRVVTLGTQSNDEFVQYQPNGFAVLPRALLKNESIQVQFVLSWAPQIEGDSSTWFAVDLHPASIVSE